MKKMYIIFTKAGCHILGSVVNANLYIFSFQIMLLKNVMKMKTLGRKRYAVSDQQLMA